MNEKGTTLIEVMASIMILSISAAALYGGFSTIINFIQESNSIKNASNEMMNVIEGKSESEDVTYKSEDVTYYLKTSEGDNIKVNSNLGTFEANYSDNVVLKSFVSKKNKVLGDDENYKLVSSYIDRLNNKRIEIERGLDASGFTESIGYAYVPGSVYSSLTSYDVFPSELLPSSLKNVKDYYIRILYPWDYVYQGSGSQDERVHMGGPLIYLSFTNAVLDEETNICKPEGGYNEDGKPIGNIICEPHMDTVNLVYDYTADDGKGRWYYHEGTNYQVISSTLGTFEAAKTKGGANGFFKNGSSPIFENWDELREEIKNPVNRWKYLNEQEEYDGTNIDDCWQPVQSN